MDPSRTPLIGRDTELEALASMLGRGARVTVVGPGGVGKSALARALCEGWSQSSQRWCGLAHARSPEDVGLALGAALGSDTALSDLGDALVVLDGVGQLPEPGFQALQQRLASARDLRVLCTARRPSGLHGEVLLRLARLDVDAAAALFVWFVSRRQHGWSPPEDERRDIVELAERLDRLPLALALAAARRSVLAPREMIDRLSDRFRLLRPVGRTTAVPALWDVLADTWSGLSDEQRDVLCQCSVFRGGFTLDACSDVVHTDAWHLDVLHELVEASVVDTRQVAGATRFELSESVRDFTRAFVADRAALAERHAVWMERLLAADPHVGPALAAERWNAVAAFEHWLPREPARALRLILDASRLARMDSPLFWLERVERAAAAVADPDPELWVQTELVRARLRFDAGRAAESLQCADRAAARAADWPRWHCDALRMRGIAGIRMGHLDQARTDLEEALQLARTARLVRFEAHVLLALGGVLRLKGDEQQAFDLSRASRDRFHEIGDAWGEGAATSSMASGETEPARQWAGQQRACVLSRDGGNPMGEAVAHGNLARLALLAADPATSRHEAALGLALAAPWPFTTRWLLALQAGALVDLGELDAADSALERADALTVDSDPRSRLGILAERAEWHVARGERTEAIGVLERALALEAHDNVVLRHAQLRAVDGRPVPVSVVRGEPWAEIDAATAALAAGDDEALAALLPSLRERLLVDREPSAWTAAALTRREVHQLLALVQPTARAAPALVVGATGDWYELDGHRVDLSRRGAQRRILVHLATRHGDGEAEPSDVYDLFEAGWPGERAGHEAVTSRVYNAVQRLRDTGLREVLRRVEDGYVVDPAVAVRVAVP